MLCQSNCFLLRADGIAEFLKSVGHSDNDSEVRGAREMITKGRVPVFRSPFNNVKMVCREVVRYKLVVEQTRAVQEFSGSNETVLPPPPPCMCQAAGTRSTEPARAEDQ